MGQSKSKQIYAFQPLPWPEALAAFRLIDQICGIASTFATNRLGNHAVRVLEKIGEIQRLPYKWEAFGEDFDQLRGTHMVRLAAELHKTLDELEGCKYDMGMMAEKGIAFKSQRRALDKVLAVLQQVEKAHQAFHYAFELALYGSTRDVNSDPMLHHSSREERPEGHIAIGGAGGGTISRDGARQIPSPPPPRHLAGRDPWPEITPASPTGSPTVIRGAVVAVTSSNGARAGQGGEGEVGRVGNASSTDSDRRSAAHRGAHPRAVPLLQPPPLLQAPPLLQQSQQPQRQQGQQLSTSDDVSTSLDSQPPVGKSSKGRTKARPASSSPSRRRIHHGSRGDSGGSRDGNPNQQFVVMYLPQGPDGGGPRAILVPANAMQPAPAPAPLASTPGAPMTVTPMAPSSSPYRDERRRRLMSPPQLPQPVPQPTPPVSFHGAVYPAQPAPHTAYLPPPQPVAPSVNPPPLSPYIGPTAPLTIGPPLNIHPSWGGQQEPGGAPVPQAALAPRTSMSPAGAFRYLSSRAPSTAPGSIGPGVSGKPRLSSSRTAQHPSPVHSPPSFGAVHRYDRKGTSGGPATFPGSTPPYVPHAPSLGASTAPDLSAFYDRLSPSALSAAGTSIGGAGEWGSPPPVPPPMPSPLTLSSAGAVPMVVPGAAPGSLLMLQPVTAHMTASGGVVLEPQLSPQPPVLVVAQGPGGDLVGGGAGGGGVSLGGRVGVIFCAAGAEVLGGGQGQDGRIGSHQTYSYAPKQPVPAYLTTQYDGGDDGSGAKYGEDGEDEEGLPERYPVYGGGEKQYGKRVSDDVDGVVGRRYDQSGGGAQELMRRYRTRRQDPAGSGRSAQPPQSRRRRPSIPPSPSREAKFDMPETRRGLGGGMAPSGQRQVLSYTRLAALAGLDPDVLGGGAAAALATLPDRSSLGAGRPFDVASRFPPSRYVVPGEAALQRAEALAAAAEDGDWRAAVDVASMLRAGWWGDERDGTVARGLLLQAALRGGSADAHAALGEMAERGEGLPGGRPDLPAAARHYASAAGGGHRDATTALAYLLEHGLGVEQDEARAVHLYAAAAQRDCPTATNNLAKIILDGRGGILVAESVPEGPRGALALSTPHGGGRTTKSGFGATWAANSAAAAAFAAHTGGIQNSAGERAPLSPMSVAKALFKRAARAGSAAAWYNLGVCHLQQLKLKNTVLPAPFKEEAEVEALRCFGEAAKRGHARGALRAGHLSLQRSCAAAAVEAFCAAALNAAAAAAAASQGALVIGGGKGAANGDGDGGGSPTELVSTEGAIRAARQVEAEALWCLAQLAERQAAVLEMKKAEMGVGLPAAAAGGSAGARSPVGGAGRGDGGSDKGSDTFVAFNDRRVDGGDGNGGDDESNDGTEGRVVGYLLAALASAGDTNPAVAAAAAAAQGDGDDLEDDPAASVALAFARELCRLDFQCCRRSGGALPSANTSTGPMSSPGGAAITINTGGGGGESAASMMAQQKVHGLRRLRRQARDLLNGSDGGGSAISTTAAATGAAAAADASSHGSSMAGVAGVGTTATTRGSGSGGDGGDAVRAALARLDVVLQRPSERAQQARRVAAELMAAAAALGHAAAQHWLAGWQWSLGRQAEAVALWRAAGRRRHAPALMVLGQMAEAGQLGGEGRDGGGGEGGGSGGARGGVDLAAAARYYLRAQEAGASGAVEAMRRVQQLLQRHVALQGRMEAVAGVGGVSGGSTRVERNVARRSAPIPRAPI